MLLNNKKNKISSIALRTNINIIQFKSFFSNLRLYLLNSTFNRLIKFVKKFTFLVFFFKINKVIYTKKSKNARMGKGKGENTFLVSNFKTNIFFLKNFSGFRTTLLLRNLNKLFLKKFFCKCLNLLFIML